MKKVIITAAALMVAASLTLNAQDDKKKDEHKDHKEHKEKKEEKKEKKEEKKEEKKADKPH